MLTVENIGDGFKSLFREMGSTTGRNRLRPRADVTAYRNFVLRNEFLIDVPEKVKCNRKAAQLRQEGNRLYLDKQFDKAVTKYNESICYAEAGSEHLGMGYANRSAIYSEEGEYEYALANIALARENHYPAKLLPKLAEREARCRAQLAAGKSKGTTVPSYQLELDVNVPRNEKIPFIADGIRMGRLPEFGGRGLVAEKAFSPGDVILNERPMLTLTSSFGNYCNNCAGEFRRSLIPCGGCVRAMYCSEECLAEDYRYWHRFQCGLVEQLKHVEYITTESGPKRFFYTLAGFGDDLDVMMAFCSAEGGEEDPFTVDHTKEDRILEAMKVLHNAKPKQPMPELEMIVRMSASAYYAVFMKHPLLKQIVKTNPQKDFMLRTFQEYIYINTILSLDCMEFAHFTKINVVSSISCLANHSCDPNTLFFLRHGTLRFYVIRPIREGEQITVTYGPTWWEPMPTYESVYKCRCPVCHEDSDWVVRERSIPAQILRELSATTPAHSGVSQDERQARELRRLLDFMGRYGPQYHPDGALGPKLQVIKHLIAGIVHVGAWTLERKQVAEKLGLCR